MPNSKALRHQEFRGTELARYCLDEASDAPTVYVTTLTENEALYPYKGLLEETELACTKDGPTNGTRQLNIII